MYLCIPTIGKKGLEEQVHNHFGSAAFFTIIDTESGNIEVIDNGDKEHDHGACQPVAAIAQYNVDAILTNGMGRRAIELFNNSGIKVYLNIGGNIRNAIDAFQQGNLHELDAQQACSGHKHKGSCCY